MSVPSKIHNIPLVEIQPEERLAATSELNLVSSLVTGCDLVVSWVHVIALLIASLLLVTLTAYLARYLSKEKIVTTIP